MGSSAWLRLGAAAFLALMTASGVVSAGEEELESELFFAPAETVSTAARHDQPLELSPSAVTVLTREDIEASGARTLPELLRLVPNMDIRMAQPFWYLVGVRGYSSLNGDTVLLLVDGRDQTVEFFGFPGWTMQHVSMDEVKRVEVIRGPGSALYGANAFAGVVQVVTYEPGEGPRAGVSLRGGEHGFHEVSARAAADLDGLAVSVSAGANGEDLWSLRDHDGRRLLRGRIDATLPLGAVDRLRLEAGALEAHGSMYSLFGNIDSGPLTAVFGRARLDFWGLQLQAIYDRVDIEARVESAIRSAGIVLAEIPPVDASSDKLSLLAQYGLELFHNRLTVGAEYVFHHVHSPLLLDARMLPDPDLNEHRAAGYLQDELDIQTLVHDLSGTDIPPLVLTAGLRVDFHNAGEEVDRWELSPRAALVFSPAEDHGLRLGYARAFLKPTLLESSLRVRLDSAVGFDAFDVANPSLANELIDSLELGYTGKFWDGLLEVKLSLAANWYHDIIRFQMDKQKMGTVRIGPVSVPDITGPGFGYENMPGTVRGHDVELETVLRPTRHTRLFFQAGYRQLFEPDGSFKDTDPVWVLQAGGDLRTSFGLDLSLRAYLVSPWTSDLVDPEGILAPRVHMRMPTSLLLNARVAWRATVGPAEFCTGLEAFNLPGSRHHEFAGLDRSGASDFGGERLDRRVVLFVEGRM